MVDGHPPTPASRSASGYCPGVRCGWGHRVCRLSGRASLRAAAGSELDARAVCYHVSVAKGQTRLLPTDDDLPDLYAFVTAIGVCNAMDDIHREHLTYAQMTELNPIIGNAICTARYDLLRSPAKVIASNRSTRLLRRGARGRLQWNAQPEVGP